MLTHVDENNFPKMVDVSDKAIRLRMAMAQSQVQFPPELSGHITDGEIYLKKGPVFQTAIIAGTMAAKKTHEMIPFCHQVPVESCQIKISVDEKLCATVTCRVLTRFKTGVEMEALHGATVAALTIYDMCKALSHEMILKETRLLAKTGGKKPFLDRPLYGLVLTGGKSERMKRDKALIPYKGVPHAQYLREILKNYCAEVYLSARKDQWAGTVLDGLPTIEDFVDGQGPIGGMLAAFRKHPDAYWMVIACDLVHFDSETVDRLLASFAPSAVATCYANREKGFPEALCSLYTPLARQVFEAAFAGDVRCPVKVLRNAGCELIEQGGQVNLANINTEVEFTEVQHEIR